MPIPNAIATVILAIFTFLSYCESTLKSDLKIQFQQKQIKEIAPFTLPNSQRIYDIKSGYVSPPTNVLNEVIISNSNRTKASDVTITLKIERGPFIFTLISFDKQLQPRGTWTVIPDTETYTLLTVKVGILTETKPSKFYLVFSFPSSIDGSGKSAESQALYVRADTPSQKGAVEARYDIKYW